MDIEDFRKRLDAARVLAAMQRLEAAELLAANVDLCRENSEKFRHSAQRARQLREDRQSGVQEKALDTERSQPTRLDATNSALRKPSQSNRIYCVFARRSSADPLPGLRTALPRL
jgi:hypothetical protein